MGLGMCFFARGLGLSKELGLSEATPHALRHAYATSALLSREVDVKVLADRLGHSGPAVTQAIYQGYLGEADKKAADLMAGLILGHLP
jgi:integrase